MASLFPLRSRLGVAAAGRLAAAVSGRGHFPTIRQPNRRSLLLSQNTTKAKAVVVAAAPDFLSRHPSSSSSASSSSSSSLSSSTSQSLLRTYRAASPPPRAPQLVVTHPRTHRPPPCLLADALNPRPRLFSSSSSSSSSSTASSGSGDGEEQAAASGIEVYHAGLRRTEFSSKLEVLTESQVIPIFRVMSFDGQLKEGWENPFSKEQTLDIYRFMLRLSVWDDMLYSIQRQGRISFYIQNQGEEAVQTGVGAALTVDDHLFCQYRELGVLMWRGFTLEDVLNQALSNKLEEGKGRQMPICYTKKDLNIHTVCTPLTTQVPHAAGAGYAFRNAGEKRCAVTFFGEGAASEGDFHAAMNFAATLKAQTMFVCRNNGYAISTPVQDQYAGDGIAIRGVAYGMPTVRVDGNDLFATYLATKRCREICVEESTPVCLEFMTYRMGHHSTSDDSSQYRPLGELDAWTESGIHPIARMKKYLMSQGWWTEEEEEALKKEAKKTMLDKMRRAEKVLKYAIVPGLFDDVYRDMPPHLKEQSEHLRHHLNKYADKYDTSSYEAS